MVKPLKMSLVAVTLLGVADAAVTKMLAEVPGFEGSFAENLVGAVGATLGDLTAAGAPASDGGKVITEEETRRILWALWHRLELVAREIPGDVATANVRVPPWTGQVLGVVGFCLRGTGVLGVVGEALTVLGSTLVDGTLTTGEAVKVITVLMQKIEEVLA